MKKTGLVMIFGGAIFFLGVYLFPFGQDVAYSFFLNLSGQNFWIADLYLYVVTVTMILVGLIIVKPGAIGTAFGGALKNPKIAVALIAIIVVVGYITIEAVRNGVAV